QTFVAATWVTPFVVERRPAWITRDASFVAHPAQIRARIAEHARHGLEFAHELVCAVPVVKCLAVNLTLFVGAAVIAAAAVGTVKPDLEDFAIVVQQLP